MEVPLLFYIVIKFQEKENSDYMMAMSSMIS